MKMTGTTALSRASLFAAIERLATEEIEEITSDLVPSQVDVCVCISTYQHGPYLKRAVESVLAQDFEGSIVLLIGDDHSTDGTREWLRDLQREYPSQVRLFLAKRNLWNQVFPGSAVAYPLYREGRHGRYAALLEGDDFWIDPGKLRRQVEYLDAHTSAAGCFTECLIVDEKGIEIVPRPFRNRTYQPSYNQEQCLLDLGSAYATASLMFRGEVLANGLPEYFWRAGSDFLLDLAITEHGSLDFLPETTAAYRVHAGGIWRGAKSTAKLIAHLGRFEALWLDPDFVSRHRRVLSERHVHEVTRYAKAVRKSGVEALRRREEDPECEELDTLSIGISATALHYFLVATGQHLGEPVRVACGIPEEAPISRLVFTHSVRRGFEIQLEEFPGTDFVDPNSDEAADGVAACQARLLLVSEIRREKAESDSHGMSVTLKKLTRRLETVLRSRSYRLGSGLLAPANLLASLFRGRPKITEAGGGKERAGEEGVRQP